MMYWEHGCSGGEGMGRKGVSYFYDVGGIDAVGVVGLHGGKILGRTGLGMRYFERTK